MKIVCKDCGKEFELKDSEISFYKSKGLELPKRCKACRDKKKSGAAATGAGHISNTGANSGIGNGNSGAGSSGAGNNIIVKVLIAAIAIAVIIGGIIFVKNVINGNDGDYIVTDAGNNAATNSELEDSSGTSYTNGSAATVDADDSQGNDETTDAAETPDANGADDSDANGTEPSNGTDVSDGEIGNDASAIGNQVEDNNAPEQSEPVHDPKVDDASTGADDQGQVAQEPATVTYRFRNKNLLDQHYEKHGIEMGFDSAESYEAAASAVINNPAALSKTEAEDGDYVYYVEATNEFVILSTDGYIRTYFLPSGGKAYYDRQ